MLRCASWRQPRRKAFRLANPAGVLGEAQPHRLHDVVGRRRRQPVRTGDRPHEAGEPIDHLVPRPLVTIDDAARAAPGPPWAGSLRRVVRRRRDRHVDGSTDAGFLIPTYREIRSVAGVLVLTASERSGADATNAAGRRIEAPCRRGGPRQGGRERHARASRDEALHHGATTCVDTGVSGATPAGPEDVSALENPSRVPPLMVVASARCTPTAPPPRQRSAPVQVVHRQRTVGHRERREQWGCRRRNDP